MKTFENLGEDRDDKYREDHNCDRHRHHDEHRVTHGLFDALTHIPIEFQLLVQVQEHFGQAPGHFADLHHRDIKSTERFRMSRHGCRKFAALVKARANVLQHREHGRFACRSLQSCEGPEDGNARFAERVHLTRKHEDVFHHDRFLVEARQPAGAVGHDLGNCGNLDRSDADGHEFIGDTTFRQRFHLPLDRFPAGIAPTPCVHCH
jgi:hypothetical protein